MSKKKVVLIHGSPGHPDDFRALTNRLTLPMGLEWFYAKLPKDEPDLMLAFDKAMPADECLDVIAFSLGSYAVLKWAQSRGRKLNVVILLSPTLTVVQPLSLFKRLVVSLPFFGPKILEGVAPKLADEYIERCFQPLESIPNESNRMLQYLCKGVTWAKAFARSNYQQTNPLLGTLPIGRLIVARGAKDQLVPWEPQLKVMNDLGLQPAQILTLPEMGHSLLWTVDPKLLNLIQRELATQAKGSDENAADALTRKVIEPVQLESISRLGARIDSQATYTASF